MHLLAFEQFSRYIVGRVQPFFLDNFIHQPVVSGSLRVLHEFGIGLLPYLCASCQQEAHA